MSDTRRLQVTLQICGDPNDDGQSPTGYIEVTISNDDGINWQEARRELRDKLVNWALTFAKYPGTSEIVIKPRRLG
jgi:hypothetical protein